MDKKDKWELNERILASVHAYRRRKRIQNISIVACLILLLTSGSAIWFFHGEGKSELPNLRQQATSVQVDLSSETGVKLVLGKNKEILINEDSSRISYSPTGENITINNDRNLKQASEKADGPIYNTIVVPYGKQSQISLSDGSKVWLNSGTKLTYPIAFQKEKREVYLEGEAIFEVAHKGQSPFYVVTADLEVRVLGTVFNVSSYPDDGFTQTALESGSVQLNFPSNPDLRNRPVRIAPGTLATFDKESNDIRTNKADIARYMSWRKGVFIFKNDALSVILKKISRHYRVPLRIHNDNLEKQTFSGTLDITRNLDEVLSVLQETTAFEYQRRGDQITIGETE